MTLTIPNAPARQVVTEIVVNTTDLNGSNDFRTIQADIRLGDEDGRYAGRWSGDLKPHMPQEHITAMVAFLDWLRAESELKLLDTE